jgi:hypothetical protein
MMYWDIVKVFWGLLCTNVIVWGMGLFGVDRWWPPDWGLVFWFNVGLWVVMEFIFLAAGEEGRRERLRKRRDVSRETKR